MYVRTIYLTGDPALLGKTVEGLKAEAVGLLAAQPGYKGFSIFTDAQVGKILLGSWWDTAEQERNSFAVLAERRDELLGVFAGTVTVDSWEAAVARRGDVSPGGGFRLGRIEFDPAGVEKLVTAFEELALPSMLSLDGCVGGALLIDRAKGQGSVGTLFTNRATLEASRGPQAEVRVKGVAASGVRLRSLEEFDVALVDRP